jgi:two-component system NtrC family response regulator
MSGEQTEIALSEVSLHIREQDSSTVIQTDEKNLKEAIEDLERRMIAAALERLENNKSEAARDLGISRSSLISKVKQYGL